MTFEVASPAPDCAFPSISGSAFELRRGSHGRTAFWTRQADGSVLVRLHRKPGVDRRGAVSVEVIDPVTQSVSRFRSLRQFWAALGKPCPVSVSRYTKREARRAGRFMGTEGTLLEVFAVPEVALGPKLGIDLAARGHEVRKLMWAGFGHKILRAGYDPEDVLQEIFRGLIARNNGTCPWDARKSSFGHYVHLVIGCVLTNYHRKQQSIRDVEVIGHRGADGKVTDAAGAAVAATPRAVNESNAAGVMDSLAAKLPEGLREAGKRAMAVLADGGSHREAAKAAGMRGAEFEAMLALLRA